MTDANARFAGSIPQLYERHLAPVMFEPYAVDLARRVAGRNRGSVLETACGTGILTRHLRALLPAGSRLVATDLNEPMVDYARARLAGTPGIEWRQADAAALPFLAAEFGAVACQFGVMFVPDKPVFFREARRVLKRNGLLAFNVWDGMQHNLFMRIAHEKVAECLPTDPPQFFTVPCGFDDRSVLASLLSEHGFGDVAIDPVTLEARSESAWHLATGLVQGTPLSNALRDRGADFAPIVDAVAAGLAELGGERPFRCSMRALVVSAHAV
jgi:ubiquinone/menaquinone biosynthesis C-methylase UbiE